MAATYSHDPFEPVRIKEFRFFIIQRFFFIMAVRMMGTVVTFKMYELTGDPLSMALVGLSEAIPALSLALYSGHVVDKSDKRTLLIRTMGAYLLCATGLLFITLPATAGPGKQQPVQYAIYGIFILTGIIRSFSGPASSSILAQLVPKNLLPPAVTWSTSTWLTASVSGHAAAGFLIHYAGYTGSFVVVMAALATAILCMSVVSRKPVLHTNKTQSTFESVKEGLRYVLHTRILLAALALDMFAVLFGGAVIMIPVFTVEILHVGPIGFGWLNAAADIGSMITILTLTFRPLRRRQGKILLSAVAGYGLCIITFGLSKVYLLSFIALLGSGMLDGISVVIRGTILQLTTPDNMRGRVSSVNSMFVNSSNEIGQVESGLAARLMGNVASVVFGGVMTLLVVLTTWFKVPGLKKFKY